MKIRLLPILTLFAVVAFWRPALLRAQENDDTSSGYDDTSSEYEDTDSEIDEETDEESEMFTFEDVVADPAKFGLYSKVQFDANFTAGRNAGRKVGHQEVIKNPTAYGLLSKLDVPVVRLSASPGTAFTISMPGGWKRYAQSGMPRINGWRFDQGAGLLSGVVPSRGKARVRLTPYKANNQAGAQIILELRSAAK